MGGVVEWDLDLVKFVSGLGVGGLLAIVIHLVARKDRKAEADERVRVAKENAEDRARMATDYAASLIRSNERLEHIINSTRMDRAASQNELVVVLTESARAFSANTEMMRDLREFLRKGH
jgi:hypothetical protein